MPLPLLVAVIDDDPSLRAALSDYVQVLGYRVVGFASADAFLAADPVEVTCIVSDIQMPGVSGIELTRRMERLRPQIPVILVSARAEAALSQDVNRCGAFRVLAKPFDPDDMDRCLHEAIGVASKTISLS